MTEKEYQERLNHASDVADFRIALFSVVVLVCLVVYQLWELLQ